MLNALMGIDPDNDNPILGSMGQNLWIQKWGYPILACTSAIPRPPDIR